MPLSVIHPDNNGHSHKDKLGKLQRDEDVGHVDANACASAGPISAGSGCAKGGRKECRRPGWLYPLSLPLSLRTGSKVHAHTHDSQETARCIFQSSPIAVCSFISCLHSYTLDSGCHASRSNIVDTETCSMRAGAEKWIEEEDGRWGDTLSVCVCARGRPACAQLQIAKQISASIDLIIFTSFFRALASAIENARWDNANQQLHVFDTGAGERSTQEDVDTLLVEDETHLALLNYRLAIYKT